MISWGWFIIKISSYRYRNSHYKDETVSSLNRNLYTGEMVSLYWIIPLVLLSCIKDHHYHHTEPSFKQMCLKSQAGWQVCRINMMDVLASVVGMVSFYWEKCSPSISRAIGHTAFSSFFLQKELVAYIISTLWCWCSIGFKLSPTSSEQSTWPFH